MPSIFFLPNLTPPRTLNQTLKLPTLPVHFGKEETFKERLSPAKLDNSRHTCSKLIAVSQEVLTARH